MKIFIALLVAALAIGGSNAQTGPCANIRSRAAWGARAANTAALVRLLLNNNKRY